MYIISTMCIGIKLLPKMQRYNLTFTFTCIFFSNSKWNYNYPYVFGPDVNCLDCCRITGVDYVMVIFPTSNLREVDWLVLWRERRTNIGIQRLWQTAKFSFAR